MKLRLRRPCSLLFAISSGCIQIGSFATTTAAAAETSIVETATSISIADRIRGAYYGALVADALCLGSHYEYDAHKIRDAYDGTIEKYMAPGEQMGGETHGIGWGARNYHPGTIAGDQTDYGEYNVLVLEHLADVSSSSSSKNNRNDNKSFDIEAFIPHWQKRLTNGSWKQWVCTQTKQTYQQIQERNMAVDDLGGNSNAMSLRFAAVYAMYDTEELIVDAARKVMFTHRERTAILGNEFFARTVFRIVYSHTPLSSNVLRTLFMDVARDMNDPWITQKVQQALDKYDEASDTKSSLYREGGEYVDDLALTSMARLWDVGKSEPIKVGKASPTEGTLPGALYFVLKYYDDDNDNSINKKSGVSDSGNSSLMMAAKANAMVGGDNASRSIAIGMVLGAVEGVNAIPIEYQTGLNHWDHSKALLETLPILRIQQQQESLTDDGSGNRKKSNKEL